MRKRDKDAGDALDFTGMPASDTVTPADIQQKEFGVSRFGGYRMRDVDEFLDQVTVSMTKLSEDNERLRTASGLPPTPGIGAPDLADSARQADEMIERARAEAATIVREAREQAAAMSAAGGPGPDSTRAAVAPFLSQERDFLQQLATLVQGHAESVKGMAKASRAATAPSRPIEKAPSPDDSAPVVVEESEPVSVEESEPGSASESEPESEPGCESERQPESEPESEPRQGPATQPMPPVSRASE